MIRTKELSDALRQLSKSTGAMEFEIVTGEIMVAYPALCTYAVLPRAGTALAEVTVAISIGGGSGRKSGTHGGDSYMVGTTVLMARVRYPVEVKIHQFKKVFVAYILGRAPEEAPSPEGFPPFDVTGADLNYFVQKITDAYTESQEVPQASQDMSFGTPTDVFAGDWAKAGSLQNFMMLGAMYAGMGGSPLSKIECFGLLDKIRMVAETWEQESAMLETGHYQDKDSTAFYMRRALTFAEGLGAAGEGTAPFKEGDNGFEKTEQDQTGIFRHETLGGKIGAGEWEMLAGPPLDEGIYTYAKAADKARQGMLSIRKYYNGIYRVRAAQEISFTKSLYIPVPSKLKVEDKAAFDTEDAESIPFRDTDLGKKYGDYYDEFGAEMENTEVEWDNENSDNCRIRARDKYWKLFSKEDIGKRFPGVNIEDDPRKLDSLSPEDYDYDQPSYCELKNAVTSLTEKVYALESVIRQMPDGSVAISDGHGAEIRMSRGRMVLGSAGDMEIRPGRDLIEMTPRTRVMNAGRNVFIQSAQETVSIKSEKDLKILGASGGKGLVLIESRATSDTDSELAHPDSLKRGIMIKSQSALVCVGKHNYYGVSPQKQGDALAGYSRTKNGTITIDAAAGQLNVAAANGQFIFKSGFLMATDSGMVSMAGATMGIIATTVQAAVGRVVINGPASPVVVLQELAPEGVRATRHSVTASTPVVDIGGSLNVAGSVSVSSMVRASTFLGGAGLFNNATMHYSCSGGGGGPSVNVPKADVGRAADISDTIGEAIAPDTTGITDKSAWYAGFMYPTTKQLKADKVKMRALRWQTMLKAGGGTTKWEEKSVKDPDGRPTSIWPGADYWVAGKPGFLMGIDGEVPLTEYIINQVD